MGGQNTNGHTSETNLSTVRERVNEGNKSVSVRAAISADALVCSTAIEEKSKALQEAQQLFPLILHDSKVLHFPLQICMQRQNPPSMGLSEEVRQTNEEEKT